jgi:hypothetical protein
VNATAAALDMTNAAMRDPVADEIPRDQRGSFVQRLEEIKVCVDKLLGLLHGKTAANGLFSDRLLNEYAEIVAEKLKGVIGDMDMAEGKDTEQ